MTLIQMSITAGVLILLVIILRAFTLQKLPKLIFVLLWDIVLLRLFIPANIKIPINITQNVPIAPNRIGTGHFFYSAPSADPFFAYPTSVVEHNTFTPLNIPFSPLSVIWFLGFLLCVIYFFVKYRREHKLLAQALPVSAEKRAWFYPYHKNKNITVLESDKLWSPTTFGIFRQNVILPTTMDVSNKEALHFIFLHELIHIKRKDNLIKLISLIAVCIHWFNPLVWAMYFLQGRDIEIACDEKVVSTLTEDEKASYACALISFADKSTLLVSANSFSKNPLYERIESIMKYKKITATLCIAGATLLCTLSALAFSKPVIQTSDITYTVTAGDSATDPKDFSQSTYFKKYEKYGLTYKKKTNQIMYDNNIVTSIYDAVTKENDKFFIFDESPDYDAVQIEIRRDISNEIKEFQIELKVHLPNHQDIFSSETIDEERIEDQRKLLQEKLTKSNVLPAMFSYSGYQQQINPSIQIAAYDEKTIITQLPSSITTKLKYHKSTDTWSYNYRNINYIYDEENDLLYSFTGTLDHSINIWIEKETGAITEVTQKEIKHLTHYSNGPISYRWSKIFDGE